MEAASISDALRVAVTSGQLAGAAALVWQEGQVLHMAAEGWIDIDARLAVDRRSLFRIASMSKPITSTAALMLMEEGRFSLTDPITHWAPEFSQMRVIQSPQGPLDKTEPAQRPITFEDLLTHRSGLTYGDFHSVAIAEAYKTALGGDIDSWVAPDDWIARLAALPLMAQPGAAFHYGHSTDLLGLLIARMEDMPLGDVLKRRIFDPLGMEDTGFTVHPDKRHRRARAYGFDEHGALIPRVTGPGGSFLLERPETMRYVSGGQGLWSTLDDYLKFARMFIGEGAVDGVRLLKPETFTRMVTNTLSDRQRAQASSILRSGHGFGLGVAVVMDPKAARAFPCGGQLGAVGWPGGFGGWWQADPHRKSVLLFLTHNMVELDQLMNGIGLGVFSVIAQVQALGSALLQQQ